jgi:putative membrane protein
MLSSVFTPLGSTFTKNKVQLFLALSYLIFWIYYAINPIWRPQWWLDNYLVFAIVGVIIATYRKYPLSDVSYLLLTIFMCFHAVGAHDSYSNVGLGFWMSKTFGFARPNVYDRLVHFLFGVVFGYIFHDLLRRYSSFRPVWWYVLPVEFIISYSALYEIIEAATAWSLPPEQYDPFVGLQGDIWDGYRDMSLAGIGAVISVVILLIIARKKGILAARISQNIQESTR